MRITFNHTGTDTNEEERIRLAIATTPVGKDGNWSVTITGDQGNTNWMMRVKGPGVEATRYLDCMQGQHEPKTIAAIITEILSKEQ